MRRFYYHSKLLSNNASTLRCGRIRQVCRQATQADRHAGRLAGNIIITGDLNFHLDNPAELDVRRFSETLADRGMTQLVKSPTHRGGHILDVVIVRETGSIISALPTVYDPCLCDKQGNISGDHLAVRFAVHASKPARLRKVVTFRRLRQICVKDFAQDIASSMDLSSDGSVTELVLHYNSDLRSIVDYHATLQKATVTLRPNSPWFTDTLRQEKRNRRQLERTWLRTGLEVHRQAYRTKCVAFNRMLLTTKSEYYSEKDRYLRKRSETTLSYNKEHHG